MNPIPMRLSQWRQDNGEPDSPIGPATYLRLLGGRLGRGWVGGLVRTIRGISADRVAAAGARHIACDESGQQNETQNDGDDAHGVRGEMFESQRPSPDQQNCSDDDEFLAHPEAVLEWSMLPFAPRAAERSTMRRLPVRPAVFVLLCALSIALRGQDTPAVGAEGWLETQVAQRIRSVNTAQQARDALVAVQAATRRVTFLLAGGTSDQSTLHALVQVLEHQRGSLLDIERVLDEAQRLPERRSTLDVQIGEARDAVRLQRAALDAQQNRVREFTAAANQAFAGMDPDALSIRRHEAAGEVIALQALMTAAGDDTGARRERVATLVQAMTGRMDRAEGMRTQLAVARASQPALERATTAAEASGETGAMLWLPRERQYAGELDSSRLTIVLRQQDEAVVEVRAMEVELAQLQQDESEARKTALAARLTAIETEQLSCLQAEDTALGTAADALRAAAATDPTKALALRVLEVRKEQLGLERTLATGQQELAETGVMGTLSLSIQALSQRVKAVQGGDSGSLPADYEAMQALTDRGATELDAVSASLSTLGERAESLARVTGLRERELEQLRAATPRGATGATAAGNAELLAALSAELKVADKLEANIGSARETAHELEAEATRNLRHLRTRLLWTRRGGTLGFEPVRQAWNDASGLGGFLVGGLTEEATSFWDSARDPANLRSTILAIAATVVMLLGAALIRNRLPATFSWMEAHQHGDSGRLWRLMATFIRRTNAVFLLAVGWCAVCWVQGKSPFAGFTAVLLLTPFCWQGLRTTNALLLARESTTGRVLRIDDAAAGALQTTANRLLWLSLLFVPLGLLFAEGGYGVRNPGFLDLWWFAFSLAFLALLLFGVLRPSLMVGWMRVQGTQADSVRSGLAVGWPLVVLAVLALLALEMLRYEAAARELRNATLEVGLILASALSVYYLAFARFLRGLRTAPVQRDAFDAEASWTQASARHAADVALRGGVRLLVFGPAVVLLWRLGAQALEAAVPEQVLEGSGWQLADSIWRGLLAAVLGVMLLRHLSRLLRFVLLPRTHISAGVQYAVATLCTYGLVAALAVIVLRSFDVEGNQIAWALTALSVGIGFGLQDLVRGSVAGLVLLVQRPVRVGDHVTIGAVSGTVEEITLRSTTIRTLDNATVIVPNQALVSEIISERVADGESLRMRVRFGVSYTTNIAVARKLAQDVLATLPGVKPRPAPEVVVIDAAESAVVLEVWFWVAVSENRVRLQADVREALLRAFQANAIEIPFPQMEVRVRGGGAGGAA